MTNNPSNPALGTLWMTATTLGDIRDIPLRSLELLRTCPFLVFEEDKQARQFLKAAGIHRQWMRYTEQRESFTLEELEKELRAGNDALYMSDQGTPGLADPGRDLVEVAIRIGAKLRVVPGPSSLTATISVCPIDCRRFQFAGFPPRDEAEREAFFKQHLAHPWPTILFDTPYRMKPFFTTLTKALRGTDRNIFVGVDISTDVEEFWWGQAETILKRVEEQTEKRNYVVIVEGSGINIPHKKDSAHKSATKNQFHRREQTPSKKADRGSAFRKDLHEKPKRRR